MQEAQEEEQVQKHYQAFKTALLMTPEQAAKAERIVGAVRFVYNAALEQRIHLYERSRQWMQKPLRIGWMDQGKELTVALKMPELAWIKETGVPRMALNGALQNLDRAYAAFFRRVKKGEGPAGFPRYKSRRSKQGFKFFSQVSVKNGAINISGIGWVKLAEDDYFPEGALKIASGAVTMERLYSFDKDYDATAQPDEPRLINNGAKWSVSIAVEQPKPEPMPPLREVVAVHLGLRYWAVTSEGKRFVPPRELFQADDKLRLLQRRLSRRGKGSKRRERVRSEIARLHDHIANIRTDALHKLTHFLTHELRPAVLVIERWEIDKMMKDPVFARRIGNAAWGMFWQQLKYKAEAIGCRIVETPAQFPSSRRCSECGHENNVSPKGNKFTCHSCGVEIERETNAVKNLLWYAERGALQQETV